MTLAMNASTLLASPPLASPLPFVPPAVLSDNLIFVAVVVGGAVLVLMAFASLFSRFYRKVGPEEAVVISGMGGLRAASGEGTWVYPVLHRAELMDLSVKRIEIAPQGRERTHLQRQHPG